MLDNHITSQYTHTLTVTGRQGGLYTCTVANNGPSNNVTSAQLTVQGTYNIVCNVRVYAHAYDYNIYSCMYNVSKQRTICRCRACYA